VRVHQRGVGEADFAVNNAVVLSMMSSRVLLGQVIAPRTPRQAMVMGGSSPAKQNRRRSCLSPVWYT
jgi:hypothetical protein